MRTLGLVRVLLASRFLQRNAFVGQIRACCILAQHVNTAYCTPRTTCQLVIRPAANYCSSSKATDSAVQTKAKPRVPVPDMYQEFTVFYQLPSIRIMRIVSRMKLYQTAAVVLGVPPLGVLYSTGSVSGTAFGGYCAIAGLAGFMLYTMSYYLRRLIGMMSLSDCGKTVRVSHLTFWGKRKDAYIPVESLVPLSELPETPLDAYIALRRYDVEDTLFFTLRWGQITDPEKFTYVFGSTKLR